MNSNAVVLAAVIPFLFAMVLAARAAPAEVRRSWLLFWWTVLLAVTASGVADATETSRVIVSLVFGAISLGASATSFVVLYAAVATVSGLAPATHSIRRWSLAVAAGTAATYATVGVWVGPAAGPALATALSLVARVVMFGVCVSVAVAGERVRRRSPVQIPGMRMTLFGVTAFAGRQAAGIVVIVDADFGLGAAHLSQLLPVLSVLAVYLLGFGSLVVLLSYEREQALARERLLQRDERWRSLGQMAAGIAHDFNNVLAVVAPSVEMVREDVASGDRELQSLADIEAAAARGQQLVSQLMWFARSGEHEQGESDMSATLDSQRRLLERLIPAGVTLEVRPAPAALRIRVAPARIHQLILNLVVNARDAMPRGGTISVRSVAEELTRATTIGARELAAGRWVVVEVSDQGDGIPAAVLNRMFEPFFTTKSGVGTGLGLATVRAIVMEAGGAVEVESTVGVGSRFRCWFPAT